MSFTDKYSKAFQYLLPTPLSIAFLLTLLTFVIAFFFTEGAENSDESYLLTLLGYWENGLWNNNLMVFAMQMMLMLVLGHILALTPVVEKLIQLISKTATNNARAAALVTFSTILVGLFNWGLGLIFGAIICRKIGEHAARNNININYSLIGAGAYSSLMVWHGGISGSSTTKVAEKGHLKSLMEGIMTEEKIAQIPDFIPFSETVFSSMNIYCTLLVLTVIPLLMYLLGKKSTASDLSYLLIDSKSKEVVPLKKIGAEKIDYSSWVIKLIGMIVLFVAFVKVIESNSFKQLGFITPNFINLSLLGLGLFFHKNIVSFLKATDSAIGGAAGILIQFPLYFGIMGIMKDSGLVVQLSSFFTSISNETTFPVFTLISAGMVNVFVPSGGGQWAIQGPIIVQAAQTLDISFSKSIMALAYGDQLTNMLQPFWALPLLGITKLKAREILPYTLIMMVVGGLIYLSALLLF